MKRHDTSALNQWRRNCICRCLRNHSCRYMCTRGSWHTPADTLMRQVFRQRCWRSKLSHGAALLVLGCLPKKVSPAVQKSGIHSVCIHVVRLLDCYHKNIDTSSDEGRPNPQTPVQAMVTVLIKLCNHSAIS